MSIENSVSELEATLRKLDPIDLHFVYIRLIFERLIEHNPYVLTDDIKLDQIIWLLKDRNIYNIQQVILGFLDQRESALIPKIHTEWIDANNERLCIFLWVSLLRIYPPEELTWFDRWGIKMSHYQIHLMPMKPSSAASCLKLVLDFFYVFSSPCAIKIDLLNKLRQDWEQAAKFKHKMFKALEQGNDQITRWFWEYSIRFPGRFLNFRLDFETFAEKLSLVQALCDSLELPEADKSLILNKAYSAYHAKKFKEKPKNLKGANFWLGPEQIRMLNEIAWRKKLSEKDALYSLVNDAYLKIIK